MVYQKTNMRLLGPIIKRLRLPKTSKPKRKSAKYCSRVNFERYKKDGRADEFKVITANQRKVSGSVCLKILTWQRLQLESHERGISRSMLIEGILAEWLRVNDKVKELV